jgi:DNA-binding transcriptional ArsR family regulator
LGDETRLRLINRLCDGGPASIGQLSRGFGISRQAVTKHLQIMEVAGFAHSTRRGRESLWQLDQEPLEQARAYLDQISSQWDRALDRLRAHVEETNRS